MGLEGEEGGSYLIIMYGGGAGGGGGGKPNYRKASAEHRQNNYNKTWAIGLCEAPVQECPCTWQREIHLCVYVCVCVWRERERGDEDAKPTPHEVSVASRNGK